MTMNMKPAPQRPAQWGINKTRAELNAARERIAVLEDENARLKRNYEHAQTRVDALADRERAAKTRLGRARNLGMLAQGEVSAEIIAKCQTAVALGFKPTLSIGFGFAGDAQTPTIELWAEEVLS